MVSSPWHAAPTASIGSGVASVAILGAVAILLASCGVLLLRRRTGDDASNDAAGESSSNESRRLSDRDPADDHEVVRRVLREEGGRTRQSVIVEETGWSKAKVSSVLAEMDDDGDVSKLRVGRENLVSLPGHEPDAVDSPLED